MYHQQTNADSTRGIWPRKAKKVAKKVARAQQRRYGKQQTKEA